MANKRNERRKKLVAARRRENRERIESNYATDLLPESTTGVMIVAGTHSYGVRGIGKTRSKTARYETSEQCQTVVGGNMAWGIIRDENGKPLRNEDGTPKRRPVIIGWEEGAHRCPNRAVLSIKDDRGQVKKRCREHLRTPKERDVHPMPGEPGYVDHSRKKDG
jgi:hypothetical protein